MNSEDVSGLTEAYHRAHRAYALVSGLLLTWALIGIELSETPVENIKVKLLAPTAVPYVLCVLIAYFWFRTVAEWFQCPEQARRRTWARADFFVAHGIAVLALAIYILQVRLEFQLVQTAYAVYAAPTIFGLFAALGWLEVIRYKRERQTDHLRFAVYLIVAIAPVFFALPFFFTSSKARVAVAFGAGSLVAICSWFILRRYARRANRQARPTSGTEASS